MVALVIAGVVLLLLAAGAGAGNGKGPGERPPGKSVECHHRNVYYDIWDNAKREQVFSMIMDRVATWGQPGWQEGESVGGRGFEPSTPNPRFFARAHPSGSLYHRRGVPPFGGEIKWYPELVIDLYVPKSLSMERVHQEIFEALHCPELNTCDYMRIKWTIDAKVTWQGGVGE